MQRDYNGKMENAMASGSSGNKKGGTVSKRPRKKRWDELSDSGLRQRDYRDRKKMRKSTSLTSETAETEAMQICDSPDRELPDANSDNSKPDSSICDEMLSEPEVLSEPEMLLVPDNDIDDLVLENELFAPIDNQIINERVKRKLNEIVTKYRIAKEPVNQLLSLLRPFFPHLPKDARTLRSTPRSVPTRDVKPGKYAHLGVEQNMRLLIEQLPQPSPIVEMDFFADGVAFQNLSKNKSSWVLLGRFLTAKQCFCIGVFNGPNQPADFNDLLKDFTDECLRLTTEGVLIGDTIYRLKLNNFIGDSMAQADIAHIKSPVGEQSCPYCKVIGKYHKNRMTFCDLDCEPRTDTEYRSKAHPMHHRDNGASDLFTKLMNFPSNSPIDYLHNVLLGACKRFLTFVIGKTGAKNNSGILNAAGKLQLQEHMKQISENVPSEIHHECRNLKDFAVFKGSDFRVFLLKVGPAVLKNLSDPDVYATFLLLYSAITILCDPIECLANNDLTKILLQDFIVKSADLFGDEFVVSVVHRLIHLPDIVKQQGRSLDGFSSFPFESYIANIKGDIHSSRDIIKQIYNRRIEHINAKNKFFTPSHEQEVGVKLGKEITAQPNSYKSLKFNGVTVTAESLRDGFLLTNNKEIVLCKKISLRNGAVNLTCSVLTLLPPLFTRPIEATKLNFYYCENVTNNAPSIVLNSNQLDRKMFYMPQNDSTCSFAPLRKFTH